MDGRHSLVQNLLTQNKLLQLLPTIHWRANETSGSSSAFMYRTDDRRTFATNARNKSTPTAKNNNFNSLNCQVEGCCALTLPCYTGNSEHRSDSVRRYCLCSSLNGCHILHRVWHLPVRSQNLCERCSSRF